MNSRFSFRGATENVSPFLRVSLRHPCPVCGKPDWCLTSPDRSAAICGRVESPKRCGDAGWLHVLDERPGLATRTWVHPSHYKPPAKSTKDFGPDAAKYAAGAGEKRLELAGELGVSVESLDRLAVGWSNIGGSCWTFPERDGAGTVIGLSRRFVDGSKRSIGSRGLTYPSDWNQGSGPVLLVEGGSDVAAGLTMGLAAVGRPSNRGGVEHLAELLWELPDERSIIVVGELDTKPDGRCPGRDGAKATAAKLAELLGRPVSWSMPPDSAKDMRSWLRDHADQDELGKRFVDGLMAVVVTVEPPAAVPVVVVPDDVRPVVELKDVRSALGSSRLASIGVPGAFLDGSETGSGKTTADVAACRVAADAGIKSLVMVPTHANGDEVLADLRVQELSAAKYPKRLTSSDDSGDSVNCWNLRADAAERIGLPVVRTVCMGCPHEKRCKAAGYLRGLAEAKEATAVVATHQRGAFTGLEDLAEGRGYVAIHEDPTSVLVPSATVDEMDLAAAARLLDLMLSNPKWLNDGRLDDEDTDAAMRRFADLVDELVQTMEAAESTTVLPVLVPADVPAGLLRLLLSASLGERVRFDSPPWRLLLAFLAGELERLAVVVHPKAGGTVEKSLVGVWRNMPPESATVWFADATTDADRLAELLGRPVTNATPDGRVERTHKAVQAPKDITRRTSGKTVAGFLRAILADRPECRRVGVIHHRPHADAVAMVADEHTGRIVRTCYFGQGDERSSNAWHRECDLVVVLGTPRPGPDAVRKRLVILGEMAAAAVPEPEFGPVRWVGRDERGERVEVEGRRYSDERWQRAFTELCRSELVQCIGRGRGILEAGVPVVVVSTEECGLPVSDAGVPKRLNDTAARILAVLNRGQGESDPNANRSLLGKASDSLPTRTARIASAVGVSVRVTNGYLVELESAGLVRRDGKRGWFPVIPPEPGPDPDEVQLAEEREAIQEAEGEPAESRESVVHRLRSELVQRWPNAVPWWQKAGLPAGWS